ncbi:hypothetical protein ACWDV7_36210 [Streptomyces sp. NPDC003362]
MPTTPYRHVAQRARAAAQRARTIADIARNRYTTDPAIRAALLAIAGHLDTAAHEFDAVPPGTRSKIPNEATEPLFLAEQIAVDHPATRFPAVLGEDVLVPLVDRDLPLPARLNPTDSKFARREADLLHVLLALHADGPHQFQRTDDWLRQVFTVWQQHMRLADEVRIHNSRPGNQR